MNHLTRNDYATALRLLAQLETEAVDLERFARAAVTAVGSFVASDVATLSICDLRTGHRKVVGLPGLRIGPDEIACFDRHFFEHPLVRRHGLERGPITHRISDSLSRPAFRATALYADYYRKIGLDCVMAVPLFMNGRTLASIVLNRCALDFSERDKERLELLRPHLAYLYRQACRSRAVARADPVSARPASPEPIPVQLTTREGEVMHWLSYGKTSTEIAALLAISPRTVHKHLEHIYVKLGVETRTAAVMRARSLASAAQGGEPAATSGYRPGRGTSSPGTRPSRGSSLRGPAPIA